jgi:hypothetical protein
MRSIARLYDSPDDARRAVLDLEAAGFAGGDITYMGGESATRPDDDTVRSVPAEGESGAETGAATGATLGTVIGGGAGLLAGLGALAIPGVGPVVAAGWLIATLTGAGVGAAAGGLLGALGRGGHLVVVRAEGERVAEAERILDRHSPVDMAHRSTHWRDTGWTGPAFPAVVDPLTGLPGTTRVPGVDGDVVNANDLRRRRPSDVA